MSKVRGIRFTDKEESQIEEFLTKNPLLDFSTMAKLAIQEFIRKPTFSLNPIKHSMTKKDAKNARTL